MKPSTRTTLDVLVPGQWVTTHDLLMAGCGVRYSARIMELRREFGYQIDAEQVRPGSWRYRRAADPQSSVPPESRQDSGLAQAPKSPLHIVAAPEGQTYPLPAGVVSVRAHSRRVHPEPGRAQMVLAI